MNKAIRIALGSAALATGLAFAAAPPANAQVRFEGSFPLPHGRVTVGGGGFSVGSYVPEAYSVYEDPDYGYGFYEGDQWYSCEQDAGRWIIIAPPVFYSNRGYRSGGFRSVRPYRNYGYRYSQPYRYDGRRYDNRSFTNRGYTNRSFDNRRSDNRSYTNRSFDNRRPDNNRSFENRRSNNRSNDNSGSRNRGRDSGRSGRDDRQERGRNR